MIPLDEHITGLSHVILATDDIVEWGGVYEWLHIAGSVESVSLDTIKNNQSFGWCRDADEYDIARDKLMQSFVQNLAIFNFVWGALESSIDIVKPPKHPEKKKRGKVSNTCYLLGKNFNSHSAVKNQLVETINFKDLSQELFGFDKVQKRISKVDDYGVSGVGLYAVYELRNLFAHGSMTFPVPDENNEPNSSYDSLIKHATRIVLFAIQMLMLHHFDGEDYEICHLGFSEDTTLDIALRSCHLEPSEAGGQADLFNS